MKKYIALFLALALVWTAGAALAEADASGAWYADLNGLSLLSQTNTFEGKTVKLATDIVWNELGEGEKVTDWATTAPANTWTPIGDQDNGFKGVFDGQGHTVSGLYVKNTKYAAFFARVYGAAAAVKNVNIVDSYFESSGTGDSFHNGAGIVGRANNDATISGIYTNAYLKGVKGVGLVAFADSTTTCNIANSCPSCYISHILNEVFMSI